MGTFILMASLVCSVPNTVGLLIVDHVSAAATPELQKAAVAQVQKMTHDAKVEVRLVKRSTECNLDGFYEFGVDFEQCKVNMPNNVGKLYVIELELEDGKVEAKVAFFDRDELLFPITSYAVN